ncbi:MAG: DUF4162 domain-containing protein, partial [Chrysiogenales bacterium]
LLDEPTNGVDPVSRREFWDILYALLGKGVTIVVTTAYLDEAERSNRVALMYRGRFIRLGEPKSLRNEMKKEILQVVVDDSRKAENILKKLDRLKTIRTGNSIRIFTDSARNSGKRIERALKNNRVAVISMEEVSPRLEDSFIEIITEEEAK